MIIKLRALERLREVLEREVKEIRGLVCAGPATRDKRLRFPSVSLVPTRFSFRADQADEHDHVRGVDRSFGPLTAVFNVGLWQGTVEIRVGAKTPRKRYELEYLIEQVFLGNADGTAPDASDIAGKAWMRPGIILVDVPECDDARCAFEMDDDTWENEKVFSNEFYSVMRVTANIPALVRARNVPDIDSLKLSLTEDLETVVTTAAEVDALPDVETVSVLSDGTITL